MPHAPKATPEMLDARRREKKSHWLFWPLNAVALLGLLLHHCEVIPAFDNDNDLDIHTRLLAPPALDVEPTPARTAPPSTGDAVDDTVVDPAGPDDGAATQTKEYELDARVQLAGTPLKNVNVLVTLRGRRGTQHFLDARLTESDGIARGFRVPRTLGQGDELAAIEVRAEAPAFACIPGETADKPATEDEVQAQMRRLLHSANGRCWTEGGEPRCGQPLVVSGETRINVSDVGTSTQRAVRSQASVLGLLLLLFVDGIVVAFIGRRNLGRSAVAISLVILGVFAIMLFVVMAAGYAAVVSGRFPSDLLEVGVGYIQRGTFVAGGELDWLYSLTLPSAKTEVAGKQALQYFTGFGAPLWVMVLSVAGAAILAVQFILSVVATTRTDRDDEAAANRLMVAALQRQIMVAFAPMGAIFVYQGLVGIGVYTVVPVATAALASGLAVDLIMDAAWRAVLDLFTRSRQLGKAPKGGNTGGSRAADEEQDESTSEEEQEPQDDPSAEPSSSEQERTVSNADEPNPTPGEDSGSTR